jgi:CRP/FNR family transcriptional regulator
MFTVLKEKELDLIDQNKYTVAFKKGETIRKQGTFLSHVVSLNSGLAKLYLEGSGFSNAIIRIVKPTNFIGGPGIYFDKMHHYTVTALQDSTVCFIDTEVFKKIIDSNKAFAHEFMKDFSHNVISVYARLLSLTQKQAIGRMADTLQYLFDEIFESSRFAMLLTKQDLADLSGMSKESAIQVLRQFNKEGIIRMSRQEMELLDRDQLIRMSQFC